MFEKVTILIFSWQFRQCALDHIAKQLAASLQGFELRPSLTILCVLIDSLIASGWEKVFNY